MTQIDKNYSENLKTQLYKKQGYFEKEELKTINVNYPNFDFIKIHNISIENSTFDAVFYSWRPDFVFYDAGVDVHREDSLGSLNISDRGLFDRDFGIISRCVESDVPVATVIGGGYDNDHFALAARHGIVFEAATKCLM